jgi:diguanylate cyclase (GGDEF)-like protein
MRKLLRKLGQLNLVLIATVLAVLLAVGITSVAALFFATKSVIETSDVILIGAIVPVFVTPIVTWPLIGLLLKVDTLEEKMRYFATFDELTGMLSRSAFFHDSTNLIELSYREQLPFSVLAVDLDNFKLINDEYGHSAGDEVLREFSKTTKAILRTSDLAGRIGGEEFAIILANTTGEKASQVTERLHNAIRKSIVNDDVAIKYTVSVGLVSIFSKEKETIDSVLKQADIALYQAKNNGRNRTVILNANKAH